MVDDTEDSSDRGEEVGEAGDCEGGGARGVGVVSTSSLIWSAMRALRSSKYSPHSS